MKTKDIEHIIYEELPKMMKENEEIRDFIIDIGEEQFADREVMDSRFDKMLNELKIQRLEWNEKWEKTQKRWEENDKRWKENNERWKENNKRWKETQKRLEKNDERWEKNDERWEENRKLWEESQRRWEKNDERWKENRKSWEESQRRWEENNQRLKEMSENINLLAQKHDSTIGALGARWGLHTEQSFRNALKSILETSFDVQVENVNIFDKEGKVFGRPDQVELDIIIKDGILIICEIKSSMSKSDMYIFERKVRFYEELHNTKANRTIVISPMIEPKAIPVAEKLGIECFSYAENVEGL
jgi:hypothetical protein